MEAIDPSAAVCPRCGYAVGTPAENMLQLEPGSVLENRYLIGRSLGYGSFGITYIAWDGKLERKVAIKEFLPSQFATRQVRQQPLEITNEEKYQRQFAAGKKKFLEEGRKLSQTNGIEGVVHMYDCFEANNTAYIVMEYLRGETLADLLKRRGTLTEAEAKDLAVPLLQALQEVHARGIIHRDIAPDNIFLARDDENNLSVKLIDFGAARFSATSYSKSLTMIIKPGYSPEEQYRSEGQQGFYTDVYALAAVMYKAVTGQRPPAADKRRLEISTKRRDPLVEPGKLQKGLSENFETALLNALNVRIEDRTETAEAFLEELISFEPVERRGSTIKRIDFFKWPLWAQIGVPVASLAAVGLLVYVIVNALIIAPAKFTLPEGMTRVPDFVTATYEEAQAWAADSRLLLENGGAEYAPGVMGDLVLSQSVQNGEIVEDNTLVSVVVSTGEEHYPIPNVVGMPLEKATVRMECTGLKVEVQEESKPGLAKDCVVTQSLEPFTESEFGETVVLTVNRSGESGKVNAPDFTGLTFEQALQKAEETGVKVCVYERRFSDDYAPEEVMRQDVAPETELEEGQVISLTLAQPWRVFEMPNLLYKDQRTAGRILYNMGVDSIITEAESEVLASGLVLSQGQEKGTQLNPGSQVELVISKGGKPIEIPNVKGMEEADARRALTEAAMVVRVEYDYDAKVAEGTVISQSIQPGEQAQRGTAVTIVVCSSEGLIRVENVVGMTSGDAQSALKKQGLKVQVNENYSTAAKDTVTAQLPAAGSVQRPDTVVVITVSKGPAPIAPTPAPAAPTAKPVTPTAAPATAAPATPDGGTPPPTATPAVTPGPWSDWSTTKPSGDYEVQQKTQYRYRNKETTSSTSSSMSGWTQTGSSTSQGDWGPWSGWQDSAVSSSSTREVNTRTVYGYYWFECPNCHQHMHCWDVTCPTWADGCGQAYIPESSWHVHWSTTPFSSVSFSEFHGTGHYIAYVDGIRVFKWTDGIERGDAYGTQYQYRDRQQITTYTYERWGDWSAWQDSSVSGSSTRQVETRTVYRYRTKGSS